jgi:hypothetical protein
MTAGYSCGCSCVKTAGEANEDNFTILVRFLKKGQ